MPEAVSDLDDMCAALHPPFLTLIFHIRCSVTSGSWGRWSCLEQINIAKICFFTCMRVLLGQRCSADQGKQREAPVTICVGATSLCVDIKCGNETRYIVWLYIISMVLFSYLFCQYAETLLTKLHRRVLYHFWLCTWCILFVYERIFLKTFSN